MDLLVVSVFVFPTTVQNHEFGVLWTSCEALGSPKYDLKIFAKKKKLKILKLYVQDDFLTEWTFQ